MTVTLSRAGLHVGSGCGRLARLFNRVRRRRIDDTQILYTIQGYQIEIQSALS